MKISNEWICGFFDGEGSISIVRRKRGNFIEHHLSVQVGQNDKTPLDLIAKLFKGSVCNSKTPSGCWRWRVHGKPAEIFLKAILPFSIVKKKQIELALELRKLIGTPGKRSTPEVWNKKEKIWQKMQIVKGKTF
jgi:hypothetical protein